MAQTSTFVRRSGRPRARRCAHAAWVVVRPKVLSAGTILLAALMSQACNPPPSSSAANHESPPAVGGPPVAPMTTPESTPRPTDAPDQLTPTPAPTPSPRLVAVPEEVSPSPSPHAELLTSDPLTSDQLTLYAGQPGVAKLTWNTPSEKDNFGFLVMRCDTRDGAFVTINDRIIYGAGNSSTPNAYAFYDLDVKVGHTYFYRIDSIARTGGEIKPVWPVQPFTVNRLYRGGAPPTQANPSTDNR
jgi:hypothetical protein